MTEWQLKQREIEENAGREAVKKAEAELERSREARSKALAEEKARQGEMTEVRHPNPGQDEQFPASKATLGKVK